MDWSAIISTLEDQVGTLNKEHQAGELRMQRTVAPTGGCAAVFLKIDVFASSWLWRKINNFILDHLYGQTDIVTNHLKGDVVCVTVFLDVALSLDGFPSKSNGLFFWDQN